MSGVGVVKSSSGRPGACLLGLAGLLFTITQHLCAVRD
mgnify:CR=1 FL=1